MYVCPINSAIISLLCKAAAFRSYQQGFTYTIYQKKRNWLVKHTCVSRNWIFIGKRLAVLLFPIKWTINFITFSLNSSDALNSNRSHQQHKLCEKTTIKHKSHDCLYIQTNLFCRELLLFGIKYKITIISL